jgi:hypothetical protein
LFRENFNVSDAAMSSVEAQFGSLIECLAEGDTLSLQTKHKNNYIPQHNGALTATGK